MSVNLPSRVLLIDDDELSRAVLELHLAQAGFDIIAVESGDHALALLRAPEPPAIQAVLSDLQMPGLSGPALAAELRAALAAPVRLIAMSGSEPRADRLAGFEFFLLKPFTPEQFVAALSGLNPVAASEPRNGSASTESGSAPVVMDEPVFAQLRSSLSCDQLAEFFALSFSELEKHVGKMETALQQEDRTTFRESAHAVKGCFAILGARELQQYAAELETGSGTSADKAATLKQIPGAADRLKRMLTSRGVQFSRKSSSGQETK